MELKNNKTIIFKNKKKNSDKHPDWRGEIDVEGKRYEISLWENTSKTGDAYYSGGISEPYQKAEPPESDYKRTGKYDKPPAPIEEQDNDSLPF